MSSRRISRTNWEKGTSSIDYIDGAVPGGRRRRRSCRPSRRRARPGSTGPSKRPSNETRCALTPDSSRNSKQFKSCCMRLRQKGLDADTELCDVRLARPVPFRQSHDKQTSSHSPREVRCAPFLEGSASLLLATQASRTGGTGFCHIPWAPQGGRSSGSSGLK